MKFKNILFSLIIFGSFILITTSCVKPCNKCLELVTKNIIVEDSNGNNLIFGNNSIYNPDNISIILSNSEEAFYTLDSLNRNINLIIENETLSYYLNLNDSVSHKINFTQKEIPSPNCCGNIPEISESFVDNIEVNNNRAIIITE